MTDHLPECMTPDDPCADPESCDSLACARQRLHLTLRDEADQREGGHLPECRYYPQQSIVGDVGCICKALRACEARVRRDVDDVWVTQHDDHITWEWKGDTGYALVQREVLELLLARCNEPTYASGLSAARDAVADVAYVRPAYYGKGVLIRGCEPDMVRQDALAAIDALRGES